MKPHISNIEKIIRLSQIFVLTIDQLPALFQQMFSSADKISIPELVISSMKGKEGKINKPGIIEN